MSTTSSSVRSLRSGVPGFIGQVAIPASGVTAGSYTNTNLTVDAQGHVTAASNGAGGTGSFRSIVMYRPTNAPAVGVGVVISGGFTRLKGTDPTGDFSDGGNKININNGVSVHIVATVWDSNHAPNFDLADSTGLLASGESCTAVSTGATYINFTNQHPGPDSFNGLRITLISF